MAQFKGIVFTLRIFMLAGMVAAIDILNAQTEFIITAGSSHFLGDLGGKPSIGANNLSDVDWESTRYMGGLGIRQNLGKRFAIRATAYYARLAANDKFTSNTERHMRNLNFFTPVGGADAVVEWKWGKGSAAYDGRNWYFFAGMGYFRFDPRTTYNGAAVRLQPLGTEGQYFMNGRNPYKLGAWSIPFGIGYKIKATRFGYLSFQVDARKTFTDYIDDVSTTFVDKTALLVSNGATAVALSDRSNPDGRIIGFSDPGAIRGNPRNNDNFFFLSVQYNIVLGGNNRSTGFSRAGHRGLRRKSGNGCYSF
jgi:hypothetical protein